MLPSRPFYFIRHGETDWNREGRMQGHTDIPLNATGLEQARLAATRLSGLPVTRIISSPLLRAFQTAEALAQSLNLPLEVDDNLKERSFGSYEGELKADIRKWNNLEPKASISHVMPADAEPWQALISRTTQAIHRNLKAYPQDTLLFVSHGSFFRALYEELGGGHKELANATPYLLQPAEGSPWQLIPC